MVILDTLLKIIHVLACLILMFVVLLQQGRGGGLGAAFGGGAASQVFGGRGAGNILTRATAICATTFMLTSVALAYRSSSQDRALTARIELDKMRKAEKGHHKKEKPDTAPTQSAAPTTAPPTNTITMPTDTAPSTSAPPPFGGSATPTTSSSAAP